MADTELSFDDNAAVLALFPELGRTGISLAVHPDDEMFGFFYYGHGQDLDRAIVLYLGSGAALWSTIRQVIEWRFGSLANVRRLLDFASGYGRVTRHMLSGLPPDRIWISDIYPEAVRFQERELGVHGFLSQAQPEELTCNEQFDVIVVSSLFTHLPAETFERWLKKLGSLLAPKGLLMFSVHGEHLLGQSAVLPETGILFQEISESATLPKTQYGSSWVSDDFVRQAVKGALGECSLQHVPRGFASFQDLYVLVKEGLAELPALTLSRQADGFLEQSNLISRNRLRLEGWAADRLGGSCPKEVRVFLDGVLRGCATSLGERPDIQAAFPGDVVHGGSFCIDVELEKDWPPDSLLSVSVVTASGEEASLYAGRLEAALLRSAQLQILGRNQLLKDLAHSEARYAAAAAQLVDAEARCEALGEMAGKDKERLEAMVTWMRASRFWKLRNSWFALKRALRLTDEA